MAKKDTIVWVKPEQLVSGSVAQTIIAAGSPATALPRPQPIPPNSVPSVSVGEATGTWSVWDEVQLLLSRDAGANGTPVVVQRLEAGGYGNAALAVSLVLSLFPTPSPTATRHHPLLPFPATTTTATSFTKVDHQLPSVRGKRGLVLRRSLHSDLEESKGLAVIAHDAYWEEHQRRHRLQ